MSLLAASVPEALVKELEERFKPRRHTPEETLPEIMEYSGQVKLVEFIRASYEEQRDNPKFL